jgi:hypothetical protein
MAEPNATGHLDPIERMWTEVQNEFWDAAVKVLPYTITTDVPVIWHYTDVGGLFGIISKSKLWASHAFHMNDASELRHGAQILRYVI